LFAPKVQGKIESMIIGSGSIITVIARPLAKSHLIGMQILDHKRLSGTVSLMKAKVLQTLLNSIPMPDIESFFTVSNGF